MTIISRIYRGKEVLVSAEDVDLLDNYLWSWSGYGYLCRRKSAKECRQRKSIHLHIAIAQRIGLDLTYQVDHINQLRHDNTRENLRSATRSQNGYNRGTQKNSKTGFKGVSWSMSGKKYVAQICIEGKQTYLGLFVSPEEAARAYDRAAIEHYGEFAATNESLNNYRG